MRNIEFGWFCNQIKTSLIPCFLFFFLYYIFNVCYICFYIKKKIKILQIFITYLKVLQCKAIFMKTKWNDFCVKWCQVLFKSISNLIQFYSFIYFIYFIWIKWIEKCLQIIFRTVIFFFTNKMNREMFINYFSNCYIFRYILWRLYLFYRIFFRSMIDVFTPKSWDVWCRTWIGVISFVVILLHSVSMHGNIQFILQPKHPDRNCNRN